METINIQNYRIVKDQKEIRGAVRPVVQIYRLTPKAKYFKEKMISNYFYGTVEQQEAAVAKFIEAHEKFAKEVAERKQRKSDAKANLVNPFKVGDILYDSWGYDQTNIDFYQVVETGAKSVKVRSIGQDMVRGAGWLCEYVTAKKDSFIGEPVVKILQVYLNSNNQPVVHIKSRFGGSLSPWDGEEKYQSHYA